MMKTLIRSAAALGGFAAALSAQTPTPMLPKGGTFVIRNATIVPVVGPRVPNGSLVIQDGKISAMGASVNAPAGATVIDGTGLFLYPGMIDSDSDLGLVEMGGVPGPNDTREVGDYNPQNVTLVAVNPHSEHVGVSRYTGVTTVLSNPTGGLVSGIASLIDLVGWTAEEMAAKPKAAMVVNYPGGGGGGRGGGGGGGRGGGAGGGADQASRQLRELRAFFADAAAYAEVGARLGNAPRPKVDQKMEAMIPVVRGEMPVVVEANTEEQIRGALRFADSTKVKLVIRGGREAWRLADTLAARRIPVVLSALTAAPGRDDPYDMIYATPGVLQKAGVMIAFSTGSASNARNLPYNAALASAYGLPLEDALKAVTINPATIWGVADRYGSLEVGKVANVLVTNGDPLDVRTEVKHLFIRGMQVPFVDRHTELYQQFRARPKAKP